MKSKKELKKLYESTKKVDYYSFEDFNSDAKDFVKQVKNRNLVMSMDVSISGMTRKFNSVRHNLLLNICYNRRGSWDKVKVRGCGMDMHWHLIFSVCQDLMTPKEIEKYNINSLSSSQPLL